MVICQAGFHWECISLVRICKLVFLAFSNPTPWILFHPHLEIRNIEDTLETSDQLLGVFLETLTFRVSLISLIVGLDFNHHTR